MLTWFEPAQLIRAVLLACVFLVAGVFLSRLIRQLIATALRHDASERVDQITLSFLSHLSVLLLWLLLLTAYAHLIPPLNRLGTALLAGVSLVSVIVGFAAQSTLGNLVALSPG
jgi:small-conductance mechanosensitive channel